MSLDKVMTTILSGEALSRSATEPVTVVTMAGDRALVVGGSLLNVKKVPLDRVRRMRKASN